MSIILILSSFFMMYILYKRYLPVIGLRCTPIAKVQNSVHVLLDVRDFPLSYHSNVSEALSIPLAYLKRNYAQLEGKSIVLIGSDKVEIHLSARFLKSKRINVTGYAIMKNKKQEPCMNYHEMCGT
ncbi:hypothetical protein [Bacillus sp. FJAT-45037]|uniref:hypothetical protein n=1 Tax=Bacillus sp. FJAT-45037 TaxID=2011007 RepID=UPI0012FD4F1A|nr:hypothetical protein [Bacillus sp. FJAT-45037]